MTLCGVHDNMHVHTTVAHMCDYPLYLYRHTYCVTIHNIHAYMYDLFTKYWLRKRNSDKYTNNEACYRPVTLRNLPRLPRGGATTTLFHETS